MTILMLNNSLQVLRTHTEMSYNLFVYSRCNSTVYICLWIYKFKSRLKSNI